MGPTRQVIPDLVSSSLRERWLKQPLTRVEAPSDKVVNSLGFLILRRHLEALSLQQPNRDRIFSESPYSPYLFVVSEMNSAGDTPS